MIIRCLSGLTAVSLLCAATSALGQTAQYNGPARTAVAAPKATATQAQVAAVSTLLPAGHYLMTIPNICPATTNFSSNAPIPVLIGHTGNQLEFLVGKEQARTYGTMAADGSFHVANQPSDPWTIIFDSRGPATSNAASGTLWINQCDRPNSSDSTQTHQGIPFTLTLQ
ncbi:MAG: hypothetical protein ACXWKW_10140 [Asticcacaulis sp.]